MTTLLEFKREANMQKILVLLMVCMLMGCGKKNMPSNQNVPSSPPANPSTEVNENTHNASNETTCDMEMPGGIVLKGFDCAEAKKQGLPVTSGH